MSCFARNEPAIASVPADIINMPLKSFMQLAANRNAACLPGSFQYAALDGIISARVGMYCVGGEAKEAMSVFLPEQICHIAHALI